MKLLCLGRFLLCGTCSRFPYAFCSFSRWVVPYNPFLVTKYNCHINTEIVSTVKAVKYLYKYVYKGPDRCTVEIGPRDETQEYVDARYVAPAEASWRIFGFDLYENHPAVYRLEVHSPNMQSVVFEDGEEGEDVLNRADAKSSPLLGYFEAVQTHAQARGLKYQEMPSKFVWNKSGESKGTWTLRKKRQKFPTIGRMYFVGRGRGDAYFVRLLLTQRKGVSGWDDLRTVDGVLCPTFEDAARRMGLLDDDRDHLDALVDAVSWASAPQIRQLFAVILCTGCGDPWGLFQQFKGDMVDDFVHAARAQNPFVVPADPLAADLEPFVRRALRDLDSRVHAIEGRRLSHYMTGAELAPLDVPENQVLVHKERNRYRREDLQTTVSSNVPLLNADQRAAYDHVIGAVASHNAQPIFVQGPGGTGKTFLLNTILASVRLHGKIALATGSSGICATLLEGGTTAHSRLKLPFDAHEQSTCGFANDSPEGELLLQAELIVWDEITMAHKHLLSAFDASMRNLTGVQLPWGGKMIVFAGDYAQCLAVVRRGNRSQIVNGQACKSDLWRNVTTMKLTLNMRAQTMVGAEREQQEQWSQFLLDLGNGRLPAVAEGAPTTDTVQLPDDICIPSEAPFGELIDHVYPDLETQAGNMDYFDGRAIVTPRNIVVDSMNEELISRIPGEIFESLSADTADDENQGYFPPEYLNTLAPSGLPRIAYV